MNLKLWKSVPAPRGDVLVQVAACVVPAMTLAGLGQFLPGTYWFFGMLTAILAHHLIARRVLEASAVLVGTIPVFMLLRGLFLYNSLQVMFGVCLLAALRTPGDRRRLRRNRPLTYLMGACLLYWLISAMSTGDYSSNIRLVELGLTASVVFILAGHRSYLAAALLGITLSAAVMAAGLLPYGTRLGVVEVSPGLSLGNPIAMGVSAALGYLFTVVDGGRWLLLQAHPGWRITLNLVAAAVLVLSTSRGSWLVTGVGLILILLFNRAGRLTLFASLGLGTVLLAFLLQTGRGAAIEHYYANAVDADRSIEKRTTGRADQWTSFPRVFDESPMWGFGPGSGKAVSLRFTKEGKVWHSLYLLVGAETGLIGLTALTLLLAVLLRRCWARRHRCGEMAPLLALLCFMVIGVSVSGTDAISGVFLGIAAVAKDYTGFAVLRMAREDRPSNLKARSWKTAPSHS